MLCWSSDMCSYQSECCQCISRSCWALAVSSIAVFLDSLQQITSTREFDQDCVGVWVCGCVGVWVCGWVCGCVDGWVGGWEVGQEDEAVIGLQKNEKSLLWWMINHDFCCPIYLMTIIYRPIYYRHFFLPVWHTNDAFI